MCFVGHGAFGVIGKRAWLSYFGVVGIGPELGWKLEPWVGMFDITMGVLMLLTPRRAIAYWMVAWAIWTALLRPLAGEPFWEALERGGNYGVPATIIVLMATDPVFGAARWRALTPAVLARLRWVLTATVALLLVGHGALGVIGKHGLEVNYSSVMSASTASLITPYVGWFEIALALAVLVRPSSPLLLCVAAWKLLTEMLFLTAGSPVWEVVERGGSYVGPIALAMVLALEKNRVDADRRGQPHG